MIRPGEPGRIGDPSHPIRPGEPGGLPPGGRGRRAARASLRALFISAALHNPIWPGEPDSDSDLPPGRASLRTRPGKRPS